MHWDVVEARAEPGWTVRVRLADSLTGSVRFTEGQFVGVLEPLRDPGLFSKVRVDHGAIAWPGDVDLATDAMYEEIKKRGEWVLGTVPAEAPV